MIAVFQEAVAREIVHARQDRTFRDISDLARCAGLDRLYQEELQSKSRAFP